MLLALSTAMANTGEPELLASCYRTCLQLAEEHAIETISFPSISTGAYRYPIQEAAQIAFNEVRAQFESEGKVQEVVFVLFSQADYQVYSAVLR